MNDPSMLFLSRLKKTKSSFGVTPNDDSKYYSIHKRAEKKKEDGIGKQLATTLGCTKYDYAAVCGQQQSRH